MKNLHRPAALALIGCNADIPPPFYLDQHRRRHWEQQCQLGSNQISASTTGHAVPVHQQWNIHQSLLPRAAVALKAVWT
jgi:hypothetical protein